MTGFRRVLFRSRAFTDGGLVAEQIALLAADELHQAADVLDGTEIG